jgi:acyl carrier protein
LLDEVLIESKTSPITAHVSLVSLLEQTPVEERQALIAEVIRQTAADILGFDEHQPLDVRRGFFALGMDSLMAIQVRNQLENKFECYLPATVAFEYPTVEALTAYIATEIFKLAGPESAPVAPVEEAAAIDLDALSQDDLMGLLDDELRNLDKLMGDD